MTGQRRGVVIAIPVHNEQDLLGRCLDAVLSCQIPAGVRVQTVVALDRCTDASAAVAAARGVATVTLDGRGGVGRARQEAIAEGMRRLGLAPEEIWILCTDADSVVPADWVSTHLSLAAAPPEGPGAAVVRGLVRCDADGLDPDSLAAFEAMHDPHEGHPHVYGANLGVAGEHYVDAGGFGDLAAHEDVDLCARIAAKGATIVATSQARVLTSSRLIGRAREGFADYLVGLVERVHAVEDDAQRELIRES